MPDLHVNLPVIEQHGHKTPIPVRREHEVLTVLWPSRVLVDRFLSSIHRQALMEIALWM
jgi:hypothetical protein